MIDRDDLFIDGQWRPAASPARIEVISPSTEAPIGRIADADAADVDAAVQAARRAFDDGRWSTLAVSERVAILEVAMQKLEPRLEELARLVTSELGQPITVAEQLMPAALATGRYFMAVAQELRLAEVREGQMATAAVLREPVGVVASIAPWNGPFNMAVAKVVPVLAAGCTVVYKPAPETPFDAFVLAEALSEAGVPPGVFNLVQGGRDTGAVLVEHSCVDKVSFTGSTAAGRQIARACADRFARVQLELGGKSAAILLDDADLGVTMQALAMGSFFNTGQVCASFSRVLVPAARHDEVVQALVATAEAFVVGDPFDRATTMGPVVAERQRDRIESYISSAVAAGAEIATGGGRPKGLDRGWYVEPTVIVGTDNSMAINQEEVFGPVVTVLPYETVDQAIEIANDSAYGLHGGVFTSDEAQALEVARRVRTGTFSVNSWTYNIEAPFGGVKCSGIGRDTGREAVEAYLELKTVNLPASMAALVV